MIERFDIWNFQKLVQQSVTLDRRVTVFVGKSGAGKSSTLRGLRWLFTNRPTGSAFVRHGTDSCKASAVVDGREVSRIRQGSRNVYLLDGKEFAAIGTGVPDEIASLVNVGDVNFAKQHDSPYFFSLTPAQVSRELNKIIALDLIDSTLANLATEVRSARSQVTAAETRLGTAEQRRDGLSWAPDLNNRLVALEAQQQDLDQQAIKRTRIADLVRTGRQATIVLSAAQRRANASAKAVESFQLWQTAKTKASWLGGRLKAWRDAQIIVDACLSAERWQYLRKAYQAWDAVREQHQQLDRLLDRYHHVEEEACQADRQASSAAKRLQVTLTGKRCPLCRQSFPQAT